MKSVKYGVTWGLSQSMMFYGFAAAFGFGTYLVGTLKMDFEDVFRSELVTLYFTSFYCVTFLPLPSHRVFIAMVAGGIEIGRVNAFAPDYSKAKVAAAKLFALFDRKSLIDPTDPSGKTSVRLPVLSSMTFNQLVDKWCMFCFCCCRIVAMLTSRTGTSGSTTPPELTSTFFAGSTSRSNQVSSSLSWAQAETERQQRYSFSSVSMTTIEEMWYVD